MKHLLSLSVSWIVNCSSRLVCPYITSDDRNLCKCCCSDAVVIYCVICALCVDGTRGECKSALGIGTEASRNWLSPAWATFLTLSKHPVWSLGCISQSSKSEEYPSAAGSVQVCCFYVSSLCTHMHAYLHTFCGSQKWSVYLKCLE